MPRKGTILAGDWLFDRVVGDAKTLGQRIGEDKRGSHNLAGGTTISRDYPCLSGDRQQHLEPLTRSPTKRSDRSQNGTSGIYFPKHNWVLELIPAHIEADESARHKNQFRKATAADCRHSIIPVTKEISPQKQYRGCYFEGLNLWWRHRSSFVT
jgi:hypothetical protein